MCDTRPPLVLPISILPFHPLQRRAGSCAAFSAALGRGAILSPVLTFVLSVALVIGLAPSIRAESERSGPNRPDIVLFVIDTLRADRVGVYGHDRPTTPNIDALAQGSVVFEQASAPAPWTLPSVVSIMTSTFPCEHGVRVDGERLREEIVPLAEHLRRAGYWTSSFVSNGYAGKSSGLDRGFEQHAMLPKIGGETIRRWLRPPLDQPLLLYVHDVHPHDPYHASVKPLGEKEAVGARLRRRLNHSLQRYRKLTKLDFDAGREVGATDNSEDQIEAMAGLAEHRALIETLYAAEVREADRIVGEIIAELKRLDRWDDTLFVLTADHGEEFNDHGGWLHDQSLYEELIRVPLIVRLPAGAAAGRRVSVPVSLVDLMPTIADLLRLPDMARGARGTSWLPAIRSAGRHGSSEQKSTSNRSTGENARIVAERHNVKKYFAPFAARRGNRNVAVRDGAWKAIFSQEPGTLELYDLTHDPHEQRDQSAAQPERAERMERAAREWLESCNRSEKPAPVAPIEEADRERLRALGYID